MNELFEAQKRYIQAHGDQLGPKWPKLHSLMSEQAVFGDEQMKPSQLLELSRLQAAINIDGFVRIQKQVAAEYKARGEQFNVFDEDLENYAFLDPSADLSSLVRVTGLSEEDWKRAIGDREADERDDSDSIEDSELSRCCADISRIRDLLIRTKVNGGLLPSDVTKLQQLLDSHEPTTQQEILKKIFGQLKVVWDENTTKDRGSH